MTQQPDVDLCTVILQCLKTSILVPLSIAYENVDFFAVDFCEAKIDFTTLVRIDIKIRENVNPGSGPVPTPPRKYPLSLWSGLGLHYISSLPPSCLPSHVSKIPS